MKNKKFLFDIIAYVVLALILGVVIADYWITINQEKVTAKMAAEQEARAAMTVKAVPVPEVPAVTPTRASGVITQDEWEPYYPEIVRTHKLNANNVGDPNGRIQYPEQSPDIQTLYKGMAFSYDYSEAIGHAHTLEDINVTTRPHKLANCLTCKSPDFTALVNSEGVGVYSRPFGDVYPQLSETVSCYNCHANTPGTLVVTHDYMKDAMQAEIDKGNVDAANVVCAQCHVEYYFNPITKATKVPYTNMQETSPDKILEFYNKSNFVDYTNPNTGVGMIKVQHPEFETYTGEDSIHKNQFTCADCHMGVSYDESGNPFVNHEFTSPLENEELLNNKCAQCHGTSLPDKVHDIQKEITTRENEVSALLVELNQKLAAAIANVNTPTYKIDKVKALDRDAQFYWDFVFVENSEGAHNSTLSRQLLDKSESLAKQALEILGE